MNLYSDDLNIHINNDINYIKNDILAKQSNKKYCKYSRHARSITVTNMTYDKYVEYWTSTGNARKYPKEAIDLIKETINNKFKSGLISLKSMIELELNSNDREDVKQDIIKEITSRCK